MVHGVITRVLEARGCGFIASSSGVNVYFQSPAVKSHALREGQHVHFRVGLAQYIPSLRERVPVARDGRHNVAC